VFRRIDHVTIRIRMHVLHSLAFGMCSALDTLVAQAFGAKRYMDMGLYAQRAIVILTVCAIPVCFLWTQVTHTPN
jgi:Na+-driven multidrug efflux pump